MLDANRETTARPNMWVRCKHWVNAAIYPGEPVPMFVKVIRAVVTLLIITSVLIVLVMASDPPPAVSAVCRKVEFWIVTLFALEYLLRLWTADLHFSPKGAQAKDGASGSVQKLSVWQRRIKPRLTYMASGLAIVDLLAILPSLLSYSQWGGLVGIRVLRLFRLVWLCKVTQYSSTLAMITSVIREKAKELLSVFAFMLLILGFLTLLMYSAEHEAQPNVDALPVVWWCIETFTKSGAHDFSPVTSFGRIIGIVISVLGICLFAIFTGIILTGMREHFKKGPASATDCGPGERKEGGEGHDESGK